MGIISHGNGGYSHSHPFFPFPFPFLRLARCCPITMGFPLSMGIRFPLSMGIPFPWSSLVLTTSPDSARVCLTLGMIGLMGIISHENANSHPGLFPFPFPRLARFLSHSHGPIPMVISSADYISRYTAASRAVVRRCSVHEQLVESNRRPLDPARCSTTSI